MSYLRRVAVGLDQLVNALTGGDEDATISLRTDQAWRAGKLWGRVGCVILRVVFRSDHCREQEASEEAKEDNHA